MSRAVPTVMPLPTAPTEVVEQPLLRQLLGLALPVLAEQILSMLVGLNDTYLANHLPPKYATDAGAAVGSITYLIWFIGLIIASIGAGSTAIIARAKGARHKSLGNRVTGQSISAAVLTGLMLGIICFAGARPIVSATKLHGQAAVFALAYLRMLSGSLPFYMLAFVANACLRGGGDTLSPALAMIFVNIVNMVCSFALTRGWWGLPVMGFDGIAAGTVIAFVTGGVLQFIVLWIGTRGAKLYFHRLAPHWHTIKRLLRVTLPATVENLLSWFANFGVIVIINAMDKTNAASAAHMNTIRLESISFLSGLAFATAAATMVGIFLGRRDPVRAQKSAYLAYAVGGGIMTVCGLLMITLGQYPARWLSANDPNIVHLTTRCLFITGFIQSGFAANLIFGGALRGAGDTFVVMCISISTQIAIRLAGVWIVGYWLHLGLAAVWCVLAGELFLRGGLTFARFLQGGWKKIEV